MSEFLDRDIVAEDRKRGVPGLGGNVGASMMCSAAGLPELGPVGEAGESAAMSASNTQVQSKATQCHVIN